jgi:flavin reductase (DIM6/NTAB) family NADH-FMN oxidoreductase RutF
MTIDPRTYRTVVGQFATGVTVIATEAEGQAHGMTANSFTSLSLDPLLVLFCVDKRAKMGELMLQARGFSVNMLREDQEALSNYFAGSWKQPAPPPFRFVTWEYGPRLEGCQAALDCAVFQIVEGGDHWIVIGEVKHVHLGVPPRIPLLYFVGQYRRVDFSGGGPAPDLRDVEVPAQLFYEPWRE